MPKHIGIVAVSPEGSALCYRDIFRIAKRLVGDHGHPVVSLHNIPVDQYLDAVNRNDWHAVGDMLVLSARLLASLGAEFCIVPDNLMQHAVHLAEHASPVPWLTMTELVANAVVRDNRSAVGLIGTSAVMMGSTYQTILGLKKVRVLIPDALHVRSLDGIIFGELLYGDVVPESQQIVLKIIEGLKAQGCEGVILGCTEASLMVHAGNSCLPVYDAAELLAEGAVRLSLGLRPEAGAA